jgi:F0F1-type ATP synthase assembly protein I
MTPEYSSPARRPAHGESPRDATRRSDGRGPWQGMDHASRATADILAGPVAWGLLGWLADRWLGTDPWLTAIGVMAGFAGGLYLVWLRTKPRDGRAPAGGTTDSDHEPEGDTAT